MNVLSKLPRRGSVLTQLLDGDLHVTHGTRTAVHALRGQVVTARVAVLEGLAGCLVDATFGHRSLLVLPGSVRDFRHAYLNGGFLTYTLFYGYRSIIYLTP